MGEENKGVNVEVEVEVEERFQEGGYDFIAHILTLLGL